MAEAKTSSTKTTPAANTNADGIAIAALIVGIINLCSWCLPIVGCPLSLVGIGLGVAGMQSDKNKIMAIIGMVLSVLGFIATIINAIAGVAIGLDSGSF